MRRTAAASLAIVVAALLPGCSRYASSDDDREAAPTTTVRYGSDVVGGGDPPPTEPTAPATPPSRAPTSTAAPTLPEEAPPDAGSFDLRVVAPSGAVRPGVPVRVEGPVERTLTTDPGGRVRGDLPPGWYRFAVVEGCAGQLHVRKGGGATVGIASGDTSTGDLVADVRPRFQPASPVRYSGDAGWRVGEPHRVLFRLVDACAAEPPPSPAAYAAASFATNPAAEVVQPLSRRVGEGGAVEVTVRCTAPDEDVTLALADAADPPTATPILTSELMPDQAPPYCLG